MAFVKILGFLVLGIMCSGSASVEGARRLESRKAPLSSQFPAVKFNQGFTNLWGPQHEQVSDDQSQITIWLDKDSGSGFKSLQAYQFGYFSVAMKLQAGYTAGVNTAFYLSNNQAEPNSHDEIDMEFLGNIPGKPYTLQTNIYVRSPNGGAERVVTGREQQIHLWFDPTNGFHRYSILWTPSKIEFYVDEIPVRKYYRSSSNAFPSRPMWVYGSIWDASSWATDNGRYKVDYRYQPFVAHYRDFIIGQCTESADSACS